ncbi:MAG: hypothetical protein QOH91_913, partial [Mycobacterium sp.]|nr:hypothetical protein [Mycobacterium sp.]
AGARAAVSDRAGPAAAADQARLRGLLSSGYSPGSCTAAAQPRDNALAAVSGPTNTDPGGPVSVYAITGGPAQMRMVFDESVRGAADVDVPGQHPVPRAVAAQRHGANGSAACWSAGCAMAFPPSFGAPTPICVSAVSAAYRARRRVWISSTGGGPRTPDPCPRRCRPSVNAEPLNP